MNLLFFLFLFILVSPQSQALELNPECLVVKKPLIQVFKTKKAWEFFWSKQSTCLDKNEQKTSAPEVNFKEYQLIFIGLGEKRTGGFEVTIDSVPEPKKETKKQGLIEYTEIHPGADCMVTDALSYPNVLKIIPRSRFKIDFLKKKKIRNCGPV